MKKVEDILFTLAMFAVIFVVYFNIDEISGIVKSYLVSDKKIVIKDENTYTRDFNFIIFSKSEDYIPYNKDDIMNIYFNVLNNGWDEFSFYCPDSYIDCSSDLETIAFDNELLSKINNYVHPFNSFFNLNTKIISNGEIVIEVTHKYTEDKIKSINDKVDKVMSDLSLDGKSDREKITLIHDYIIKNAEYDNAGADDSSMYDSTSAYGCLLEGFSVCSGYSDAMAIFLDRLNIPNIKVSSENHVWNLVYIENQWLHLDLTWDDTNNSKYSNNYFLITKEKLFTLDSKEHNFDESFFLEAV